MALTASERTRNARRAALQRSATEDTQAMTARARQAFDDSFLPGGKRGGPAIPGMPELERQRRAKAARSLYFSRLREAQLARRRGQ